MVCIENIYALILLVLISHNNEISVTLTSVKLSLHTIFNIRP